MAEARLPAPVPSITETKTEDEVAETPSTMVLKLRKPKSDKQITWEDGTVDNEHMNKRKSKCCCIYVKPRLFDESSSESESDDNDPFHEHKPRKRKAKHNPECPLSHDHPECSKNHDHGADAKQGTDKTSPGSPGTSSAAS